MDWSILIDLWAIVGIGLEIWGFVWLLQYGKMPTKLDLKKFLSNNPKLKNQISKNVKTTIDTKYNPETDDNWEEYVIENIIIGISNPEIRNIQHKDLEDKFRGFWDSRKNMAIKLVIVGLIGQVAQIIHEDVLQLVQ